MMRISKQNAFRVTFLVAAISTASMTFKPAQAEASDEADQYQSLEDWGYTKVEVHYEDDSIIVATGRGEEFHKHYKSGTSYQTQVKVNAIIHKTVAGDIVLTTSYDDAFPSGRIFLKTTGITFDARTTEEFEKAFTSLPFTEVQAGTRIAHYVQGVSLPAPDGTISPPLLKMEFERVGPEVSWKPGHVEAAIAGWAPTYVSGWLNTTVAVNDVQSAIDGGTHWGPALSDALALARAESKTKLAQLAQARAKAIDDKKRKATIEKGYVHRSDSYWSSFTNDHVRDVFEGTFTLTHKPVFAGMFVHFVGSQNLSCFSQLKGPFADHYWYTKIETKDFWGVVTDTKMRKEGPMKVPARYSPYYQHYSDELKRLRSTEGGRGVIASMRHFFERETCNSPAVEQMGENLIRYAKDQPSLQQSGEHLADTP